MIRLNPNENVMLQQILQLSKSLRSSVEISKSLHRRLILECERTAHLESTIKSLNKDTHDILNHINVINAMCVDKNIKKSQISDYICKAFCSTNTSWCRYNTGSKYIDALLGLKKYAASNKNIELEVNILGLIPENLSIFPYDLVSIVANLLDNAIDAFDNYNVDNKVVAIEFEVVNDMLRLIVSNNGEKISKYNVERIFEIGFSTKKQKNILSKGFGMNIVKDILDKCKGEITVTSTDLITKFIIAIPILQISIAQ